MPEKSESPRKLEYLVIKCTQLNTKKGEVYLDLLLKESKELGGRQRVAKMWSEAISKIKTENFPKPGHVWSNTKSLPNLFQGVEQLNILSFQVANAVSDEEKSVFQDTLSVDPEQVINRMFFWGGWDEDLSTLMISIAKHLQTEGVFEKIRGIPAGASYHHSVRGGFLLHIDELLNFADDLFGVDPFIRQATYPCPPHSSNGVGITHYLGIVDYQILRAAIVLHDIGKVYDYNVDTLQYENNPISNCMEHTILAITLVERFFQSQYACDSQDRKLRLIHAIAAHHGKEMGAIVPKSSEAILLHHLDMISASLDVCRTAYRNVKAGLPVSYSKMLGAEPIVPKFFDLLEEPGNKQESKITPPLSTQQPIVGPDLV